MGGWNSWKGTLRERERERGSKDPKEKKQRDVCVTRCGLAIYIKKMYLKAKNRIIETQIFHHAKNTIFKKF